MSTTYHFTSAQDLNSDILDAIKAKFKTKPITIIVEEDDRNINLTPKMKSILDERLHEEEITYISSSESIKRLIKKHDL
jgi:hypothetical protein